MKTLVLTFLLLAAGLSSCSSYKPEIPIASQIPDNNKTYNVYYLFEHDGCKVYRFYDMGRYVYFTNCGGDVTAISTDSAKTRVQTMGRKTP